MRVGDLVRIGKGKKVFKITVIGEVDGVTRHALDAGANHPDAGKRVPDYFRSYTADELVPVPKPSKAAAATNRR